MSRPDFVALVAVVVAALLLAIAAWENRRELAARWRRKPEPDPFGDDRPSDEAIRLLQKRNGRTLGK